MNKTPGPKNASGDGDKIDMFGRKLPKRFYKDVAVVKLPNGYTVELDGKSIKTPAKNLLEVDSEKIAQAIATDWDQQAEYIDLDTMYTSKVVNTAIDRIAPNPDAVIKELTDYASSDLLCYRALEPESLVERENASWDPVLAWLDKTYGARLASAKGIMPRSQPVEAIAKLANNLQSRPALMLAAMHNLATLTGSTVLAFALADGHLDAQQAWACTYVDEDWQIEQWGRDEEAEAQRARRWQEMEKTTNLMALL